MGDQVLLATCGPDLLLHEFPSAFELHPSTSDAEDAILTDDFFLEGYELPSLYNTFGSISNFSKKPRVKIVAMPPFMRFRYESEFNFRPMSFTTDRFKTLIKLKVSDFVGKITILVDLVRDRGNTPHFNRLHLADKDPKWQMVDNHLVFKTVQTQPVEIYDLPSLGIVRRKREYPSTSSSADVIAQGSSHRPSSSSDVLGPCEIRFRFQLCFENTHMITVISDVVHDSKCSIHKVPVVHHLNPKTCFCSSKAEITVLGDNLSSSCTVSFENENLKLCGRVLLSHRKVALVVLPPRWPESEGSVVHMVVRSPEGGESQPIQFMFETDRTSKSLNVARENSRRLKISLSAVLRRRIALRQRSTEDSDSSGDGGQRDSSRQEKDAKLLLEERKAAAEMEIKRRSAEDDERVFLEDADVGESAFDRPSGSDSKLKQVATSWNAMFQRDDEGYTFLARNIVEGNFDLALSVLSFMPADLAKELWLIRFMDQGLTHLLLTVYSKTDSFPTSLVQRMINAGHEINSVDKEGNTLLHLLIYKNRESHLEAVLKEEGLAPLHNLIDTFNFLGHRPLEVSVIKEQSQAIEVLVKKHVSRSRTASKKFDAAAILRFAIREKKSEQMLKEALAFAGLDVHALENNERNADNFASSDAASEHFMEEQRDVIYGIDGSGSIFCHDVQRFAYVAFEMESSVASGTDDDCKPVTWEAVKSDLKETLTREDFETIAHKLFPGDDKLKVLLNRTLDPSYVFFHHISEEHRSQLVDALDAVGYSHFSKLVSTCKF